MCGCMAFRLLLSLLFSSINVCIAARLSLSATVGKDAASSCEEDRCCSASRRGSDGVAQVFCKVLSGAELNWRCHCPEVLLEGEKIQSHVCKDSTTCSRWDAFVQSVPDLESETQGGSCASLVKTAVVEIQIGQLFGPIPVEGSWRSGKAHEHAWKWSSSEPLFSADFKRKLVHDHGALDLSELSFSQMTSYTTYEFERKRLKAFELVQETESHIVTSTNVMSICQLSLGFLWHLQSSRGLLSSLASAPACSSTSDSGGLATDVRRASESHAHQSIRDTLVDMCFSSCIDLIQLQSWVPPRPDAGQSCKWTKDVDFGSAFNQAGCAGIPSDTYLALVEWVFQTTCWDFHPPSLLWRHDDKAPHAGEDTVPHEVCAEVDEGKTARGSQQVACHEGSTCSCPKQKMIKKKTLEQIRAGGYSSGVQDIASGVGSKAAVMALAQHLGPLAPAALLAMVAKDTAKHQWAELAGIVVGVSAGTALHVLGFPIVVVAAPLWLLQAEVVEALTKCEKTLGCWPAQPALVNGRCIMPAQAQQGGSPVWYLPPPGTVLHLENEGWSPEGKVLLDCVIDACEFDDYTAQRVGFHGKRVMNCQPLPFADMTLHQKLLFSGAFLNSCSSGNCDDYSWQQARHLAKVVEADAVNT